MRSKEESKSEVKVMLEIGSCRNFLCIELSLFLFFSAIALWMCCKCKCNTATNTKIFKIWVFRVNLIYCQYIDPAEWMRYMTCRLTSDISTKEFHHYSVSNWKECNDDLLWHLRCSSERETPPLSYLLFLFSFPFPLSFSSSFLPSVSISLVTERTAFLPQEPQFKANAKQFWTYALRGNKLFWITLALDESLREDIPSAAHPYLSCKDSLEANQNQPAPGMPENSRKVANTSKKTTPRRQFQSWSMRENRDAGASRNLLPESQVAANGSSCIRWRKKSNTWLWSVWYRHCQLKGEVKPHDWRIRGRFNMWGVKRRGWRHLQKVSTFGRFILIFNSNYSQVPAWGWVGSFHNCLFLATNAWEIQNSNFVKGTPLTKKLTSHRQRSLQQPVAVALGDRCPTNTQVNFLV